MTSSIAEHIIDKIIHTVQNETVKKKIQLLVLQPFIQYCIELMFPYVIIICVVFGIMLVLMISILGFLLYSVKGGTTLKGGIE
jgi:hypothetical protein